MDPSVVSKCDCDLQYRQGDDKKPANYISRHPTEKPDLRNIAEDFVQYICDNAAPKAMTPDDIRK